MLKQMAAFAMFFLLFRRIYYSNVKQMLKNLYLRIKKGSVRLFRVAAGRKYHQKWAWAELKKYHKKQEFYHGVYEGTKSVLAKFELNEGVRIDYLYRVSPEKMSFSVILCHSFEIDDTLSYFTLASHLNSIVSAGRVVMNVQENRVEYNLEKDLVLFAIFPEEIKASVGEHFAWSVRIYWAFNQLHAFGEDPLDIMIDYRRRYNKDR